MSRADRMAQEAAAQASEAGRILQAQGQAKAAEATEEAPQPVAPKLDDTRQRMLEGMYEGRKKLAAKAIDPADIPPGLPPVDDAGTVQTDDERAEAARVQKAEKAREEAALKQQRAEEKKVKDAAVQQEPTPKTETAAEPEAVAVAEPATSTTSKQKVDGVEYDVLLAEIEEAGGDRAWRLNKANENRLAKTNEALAMTRQTQAQLAAILEAQTPKTPKPTTDQLFAKLAQSRFGTDDEFAASLREAISSVTPAIDQNGLIMQATASIKRDTASASFYKENSDVMANPVVKKLAAQLEMEALAPYIVNRQPNWGALAQLDWTQFYSTIGTQVRSVVGPRQSQPSATPAAVGASDSPSSLSVKEARKASIVNLPTAAAARAVAPQEEKPETREEALTRMRKSRGIPTG